MSLRNLTAPRARGRIGLMRRARKALHGVRRVLITLAVVGLAFGESAVCVTDTPATAAQMACCVAMGHDCGGSGTEPDCCSTEVESGRYFLTVKSAAVQAPVTSTVPWAPAQVLMFVASARDSRALVLTGPSLGQRSVPIYLRVSSLLI